MEAGAESNIAYRRATGEDLDGLTALQQAWAAEQITWGFRAATAADLASKLGPLFLVAVEDRTVVGFACGALRTADADVSAVYAPGEAYLEIEDLYVGAAHRGRGVGGALLDALLAAAATHGVTRARVYSATKDLDRVLAFYRRHGFRSWYVEMVR